MKKMIMLLASSMMVATMVHAAESANTESAKVDESTNPITGTKTTTKKFKKKMKGEHGKAEAEVTEKTKVHKDGKVEKSVDTQTGSETESK